MASESKGEEAQQDFRDEEVCTCGWVAKAGGRQEDHDTQQLRTVQTLNFASRAAQYIWYRKPLM